MPVACGLAHPSLLLLALLAACAAGESGSDGKESGAAADSASADAAPALLPGALPFRYPASLYERRVQGNVTLRLYLDTTGRAVADSTRIEESSGHAALDSSAVAGAAELRFRPGRREGRLIAVPILFPVHFRHPAAPALPGDTALPRDSRP